jgi:DNA-binding HxlR family transcriptional regulator
MWKGYGQFCPIAKAAEILGERWMALVLRELMYGSSRFNEIARGLPLISRGLLSTRLQQLVEAEIARRTESGDYVLTPAGEALRPIIEGMGLWALHWGQASLSDRDLDDRLLMWAMRRYLRVPPGFRDRRIVLRFDFFGLPPAARVAKRSWWLVVEQGDLEVCIKDPGYETGLTMSADLRTFMEVLLGQRPYAEALRDGGIRLSGDKELARSLPDWLPLNGEAKISLGIVPPRTIAA